MCELVSRRGKLSELLAPFRSRYFITGEINTPVADVAVKLQELKERFGPEGTVSHLDGLSVEADDWHFNVRPSNTEPLLRLNLEARSQELMEAKRDEVLSVIRGSSRPKPRCQAPAVAPTGRVRSGRRYVNFAEVMSSSSRAMSLPLEFAQQMGCRSLPCVAAGWRMLRR